MNRLLFFLACMLALHPPAFAQGLTPKREMKVLIEENYNLALTQYKLLASLTPADRMPRNFNPSTNKAETSNTQWWCSGFFPGALWYIYEYTRDEDILKEAEARLAILEKEKHYTGNHDLGFMMFCSFGNAYRVTCNPDYKTAIDTAAMSLATRYRPSIQSIQSWDTNENFNCPVIIDNMMNLELLSWVTDMGGDKRFKDIAITHANSTLERHFRPDNSAWHILDYDLETGKLIGKKTWQGYSDSSAWARGQAWALYGFTSMYRLTRDARYLQQAHKIAAFILNHPRLPADKIPYWDFDDPKIPNSYRDASAGSIIASALLELALFSEKKEKKTYVETARKILMTLSGENYRAKPGENGGFLLKHSVGGLPFNGEVDVALTYADYYFLEALKRYQDWHL